MSHCSIWFSSFHDGSVNKSHCMLKMETTYGTIYCVIISSYWFTKSLDHDITCWDSIIVCATHRIVGNYLRDSERLLLNWFVRCRQSTAKWIVVWFFHHQPLSFIIVRQSIGVVHFLVCPDLGFHINYSWLIIAPVIDQDVNACDFNRSTI